MRRHFNIMDPMVAASLISGALSLLGSGVNFFSSRANRDFYSETGRYNRLVELGMNPNLAMAAVAGALSQPTEAPQVDFSGVGNASGQFILAKQTGSNINLQDSEAGFYRAKQLQSEMETYLLPLDFDEKVRINDSIIAKAAKEGHLFDEQASYWKETTKWIEPMSQAQISQMIASAQEAMSVVALNAEKIRTEISQQVANYAQAYMNNANTGYLQALTALTNEQTLSQEYITQKLSHEERSACYKACLDGMDYTLRQSIQGLPIPDDAKEYFVLASVLGDDDAKSKALDIVRLQGEMNGEAFTLQQKNMLDNWGRVTLNKLTDAPGQMFGGFANGFGYAAGARLFGLSMPTQGGFIPQGVNPAPAPSGTSNKWINLGRFKFKDGRTGTKFQKPDGKYYYDFDD